MEEEQTHDCSPSSSNFEVFLSFRGPDTRKNFIDHLYTALVQSGVRTFKDDVDLERGDHIGRSLPKAIEESKISIPVFSRNYASSMWCLDELVKIMECKHTIGQKVLPIFLDDASPSEVRKQAGSFAGAFQKHETTFAKERVDKWREALRGAGELFGYHLQQIANGHEAKLVQIVVKKVLDELNNKPLYVVKYPIGIDSRVEHMMRLLNVDSMDVRIVGICGMGGIGKTTIAKAAYNKIFSSFEGKSFLADVREASRQSKDMVRLQKQLTYDILKQNIDISSVDKGKNEIQERIHAKKVLIILDDVDKKEQVDAFAGEPNWFGPGSRIIITTRNEHVLNVSRVCGIYEPKELDPNQSLQLFSMHAFGRDQPLEDYLEVSKSVAVTCGGLPLALEVLGSFLFDKREIKEWKDTLEKLKNIPHDQVQKKLEISYEGLDDFERDIFLDITCFFIGTDREIAADILEGCGFRSRIGIRVLIHKSLAKIDDDNKLRMHDQLRDMGREIVRRESPKDPGMRSRLWSHEVVMDVLKKHTGTVRVEGLLLKFDEKKQVGSNKVDLSTEAFAKMLRLRLLQIDYVPLVGNFKHLPSELRWLRWHGCPLKFIPNDFHLGKLSFLDLSQSKITKVWDGSGQSKVVETLKVLDLSCCFYLIETPDFSGLPFLERLILKSCVELIEVGKSIGHLKKLVYLNLKDCSNLTGLPSSICMLNDLENLILSGCSKLVKLPGKLGNMEALTELLLDDTAIEQLPDSIGLLKNLRMLSLNGCRSLTKLPNSLSKLESLKELQLDATRVGEIPVSIGSLKQLEILSARQCSSLTGLPNSIGGLESLLDLKLDSTQILKLPDSVIMLAKLQCLWLHGCRSLSELPDSIGDLESLVDLTLNQTQIKELPDFHGSSSKLEKLEIRQCKLFSRLPDSIGNFRNLRSLYVDSSIITELPESIGSLEKLERFSIKKCENVVKLPDSMGNLRLLRYFDMEETGIVELPKDFGMLTSLEQLKMARCKKFKCFPSSFGSLASLRALYLPDNCMLTVLPASFSDLCFLQELNASHCNLLEGSIPNDFGRLSSLKTLKLGYSHFSSIPDSINGLSMLEELSLPYCTRLQSLPVLPSSLRFLDATNCISIERLSDLSNLKGLHEIRLTNCEKLAEIQGLEGLESLRRLYMSGCTTHADSLRKSLSQGNFEHLRNFSFPGSQIPSWFTSQKLHYVVPRLSNSGREIKGVILGVVFALEGEVVQIDQGDLLSIIVDIQVVIRRDKKEIFRSALKIEGIPKSHHDHIYLHHYHERDNLTLLVNEGDQIQVSKRSPPLRQGIQLKKGGIHVLYKQKDDFESEDEDENDTQQSISERLADFFSSSDVSGGPLPVSTEVKETSAAFKVSKQYCVHAVCAVIAVLLYFLCRSCTKERFMYIWAP